MFAKGTKALGLCDRCACEVKLNTLTHQYVNYKKTGIKVCRDCLDIDQREYEVVVPDNEALRDPRPDDAERPSVVARVNQGDIIPVSPGNAPFMVFPGTPVSTIVNPLLSYQGLVILTASEEPIQVSP